ncbi:MAG TPA: hypothetical protein DCS93_05685 [Microscillaceae bacterium]|nr:hypothetical protein [Microscillaceae bacterium]
MKIYLFWVVYTLFTFVSLAGQAQTKRLEIPVRLGFDQMYMAPIGKDGLVVFNKSRKSVGKGLVEYVFRKYDQDLHEDWTITSIVKRNLPFIDYAYSARTLYLLFGKAQSRNYQVVKVNVSAGFSEKFDFFFLDKLNIQQLAAVNNDIYIAGMLQGEPTILHTNLILKKTKILSLSFKGRAVIESLYLDTLNNFVNATVVSLNRGETKVLLKSYVKGKEVRSIELPNEKDKYLQDAQVIATENDEQLIVGTYSQYSERRAHQGLFVGRLTAQSELKSHQYYSFNDLKNFYGHLNEREQKRIARKILRRKKRGKKELPIQDKILLHRIVKENGQYIALGEMFYETVRVVGGAFFTPRNFPQQRIPREWEYSRAIGLSLDKSGRILWDNVMKLERVKVPTLYPVTMLKPDADSSCFVYYYMDEVFSKNFKESKKGGEIKAQELKTTDENDEVRENIRVQTRRWVGDSYLIWGYQRIRHKQKGRRKVFFVQKMRFGEHQK